MKRYGFENEQVMIDREVTANWYASAAEWDCPCRHCQNFMELAKRRALPQPVLSMLDDLGIPPEKATYVCQIFPSPGGQHYPFSYRIAGTFAASQPHSHSWGEVRCCHEPYPHGAPGFPSPHFDLEFWVTLPWIPAETENT